MHVCESLETIKNCVILIKFSFCRKWKKKGEKLIKKISRVITFTAWSTSQLNQQFFTTHFISEESSNLEIFCTINATQSNNNENGIWIFSLRNRLCANIMTETHSLVFLWRIMEMWSHSKWKFSLCRLDISKYT